MTDQFTNGYALVIGVDENVVPTWALPDVAKDVEAIEQVLVHPARCAYPKENVKVIHGQEATRAGILGGLAWLRKRLQADSGDNETAVVYYSGHGWRDDTADPVQSYLIPYDVLEDQIAASALAADALVKGIAALAPKRLLVVLDCCHAGGMGVKGTDSLLPGGYSMAAIPPGVLMGKSAPGPGAKGLEALSVGSGRAVLSSSTGEQRSYVRRDGKMSIFTYHLIEALTGHARPEEGAKEVLVSDVMGHVARRVPESTAGDWGKVQTPDYQVSGNFAVALLLGGTGWSKGQAAPDPLRPIETIDTGGGAYVENVDGPVALDGGEAVDMSGGQGALYKPQAQVNQYYGNVYYGQPPAGAQQAGAGLALQQASVATIEKPRRLEAAMPKAAKVGQQTEVWAMIALPDSRGLRGKLPIETEAGDEIAKKDVRDDTLHIEFPVDPRTGDALPVTMHLKVTAPDFEIDQATRSTKVTPHRDTIPVKFLLKPIARQPRAKVLVELFADERLAVLVGSLSLTTQIRGRQESLLRVGLQLVTAPLGLVFGAVTTGGGHEIRGDQIRGDLSVGGKGLGDRVTGDQIRGDSIRGDGIAGSKGLGERIGGDQIRGDRTTPAQVLSAEEIAWAFEPIYRAIQARSGTASRDHADIEAEVQAIEAELTRGDDVDEDYLLRRLRSLRDMAPDILEVVLEKLTNPFVGFSAAAIKVAERIQAEENPQNPNIQGGQRG